MGEKPCDSQYQWHTFCYYGCTTRVSRRAFSTPDFRSHYQLLGNDPLYCYISLALYTIATHHAIVAQSCSRPMLKYDVLKIEPILFTAFLWPSSFLRISSLPNFINSLSTTESRGTCRTFPQTCCSLRAFESITIIMNMTERQLW